MVSHALITCVYNRFYDSRLLVEQTLLTQTDQTSVFKLSLIQIPNQIRFDT